MIYLHLVAPHDNNGNSRRLFVVLDKTGRAQAVIDQGYNGHREIRKQFPDAKEGPDINITAPEYNYWLRQSRSDHVTTN